MATNNFTADGGEWNTAGNWSLGHVPTSSEDTTFTGIVTPGVTLTITTTAVDCKSIDFSTAGATFIISGSVTITCRGNLTCKTGMTWGASYTGILQFYLASATLTSNSVQIYRITVTGAAGSSLTLADSLSLLSVIMINNGGSLTTNNNTISCTTFGDNSVSGAVTLTLGSSTINCTNVSFGSCTLTVSDNTATINVTSTVDITSHLGGVAWGIGGDTSFVYVMTGGKVLYLYGTNTVGNLNVSWTSASLGSHLRLNADQVISGTLTLTGSSTVVGPIIRSITIGTPRHFHADATSITGTLYFQDIHFDPHTVDLSAIASGNCGGNEGITFRTPATYYLCCGSTNTANSDGNYYSSADDGTADGTAVFPMPQDTLIINDNTWSDTGNTFNIITNHRFGNIDASALSAGETNTLGLLYAYLLGDLILSSSGLSVSTSSTPEIDGRLKNEGSDTLDLNIVNNIAGTSGIIINSYGGSVRLLTNNLSLTGTFALTRGTFELNGRNLTCGILSSSNSNTRVLQDTPTGGKIVVNGLTGTIWDMSTATNLTVSNAPAVDVGDSNNTLTADVTLNMGGQTYGNLSVKKHAGNFAVIIN